MKNKNLIQQQTCFINDYFSGSKRWAPVLEDAINYVPKLGTCKLITFSLPSFFDSFIEKKITNNVLEENLSSKNKVSPASL